MNEAFENRWLRNSTSLQPALGRLSGTGAKIQRISRIIPKEIANELNSVIKWVGWQIRYWASSFGINAVPYQGRWRSYKSSYKNGGIQRTSMALQTLIWHSWCYERRQNEDGAMMGFAGMNMAGQMGRYECKSAFPNGTETNRCSNSTVQQNNMQQLSTDKTIMQLSMVRVICSRQISKL